MSHCRTENDLSDVCPRDLGTGEVMVSISRHDLRIHPFSVRSVTLAVSIRL